MAIDLIAIDLIAFGSISWLSFPSIQTLLGSSWMC